MSMRAVVTVLVMGIAALAFYAWSRNTARVSAPPAASGEAGGAGETSMSGASDVVVESGGDPGIVWTVPERWDSEPGSPVRLATYAIPAARGSREGARCAVYYFGPGQGGGTDENIARWIGEFENAGEPERWSGTAAGLTITRVRVRGTYLAHAGMGGGQGVREDHALLGAIVEGPRGPVFFKLIGPRRAVDAALAEFEGMLGSLKRE